MRDVIPASQTFDEVGQVYVATVAGIEQYLTNVHNEWWVGIAADLQTHLDAGLVVHVSPDLLHAVPHALAHTSNAVHPDC